MYKVRSVRYILVAIIILASVLRLWGLNNYPAGLNADEASLGYNAYSLIHTGKDEYGTSWPLTFKSFGDYKPGLYVYLAIPFVATVGLNEWAVRLPSAIFGILTVLLVYFLSKEIFGNKWVGVLSSLFLAISPWHLQFSRGGWETNVATFFITLGVWAFIKGLKNSGYHLLSLVSFLLSMYTYQSPRLIVPILVISFAVFFRNELLGEYKKIGFKKVLPYLIILTLITVPFVMQFLTQGGTARFAGLSIFSDGGPASRVNQLRGEHSNPNNLLTEIFHNKITAYGPSFLGHYVDHFSPSFLFINGDPLIRNRVPETGQFYLIETLFLIIGLVCLVKNKFEFAKLLISWLLIAPLAASITYQTPHALRALNMVIPLTLIMAYGFLNLITWMKGVWRTIGLSIIAVVLCFEFVHYLESYYIHYPKRYPLSWEYGFKEMVQKLGKYEGQYQNIVITDRYDQPYILVLFYKQYDPERYQPQAHLSERDKFNFGTIRNFGNYQFRSINKEEVSKTQDTLFVGTGEEIPENAKIIDTVSFPNGQPAFVFASGGNK